MFGVGMHNSYGAYVLPIFGGTEAGLIITLVIRLLVGFGWYRLFTRMGKDGKWAFVPIVGEYMAFRMVCDDFSWSALFGCTSFIGWVAALGIDNSVINACAWVNLIMWWAFALMSAHVFQVSLFFGLVYGSIPWAGALFFGLTSIINYKGPISLSPEKSKKEREAEKKARRKAERAQKNAKKSKK